MLEIFNYAETLLLSSENYQLINENIDISTLNNDSEILDYQYIKRSKILNGQEFTLLNKLIIGKIISKSLIG